MIALHKESVGQATVQHCRKGVVQYVESGVQPTKDKQNTMNQWEEGVNEETQEKRSNFMTNWRAEGQQTEEVMAEDESHPEIDYNADVYPRGKVLLCYFRW